MPILGAHMSIAGGYYKAAEAAAGFGMDTVQVFTKNNNQWRAKEITAVEAALFEKALREGKLCHPLSHASYLINLASPDELLWQKSLEGMAIELQRAEQLGIPYVVMHPGSFTTTSEEEGIARVALALNSLHALLPESKADVLLEITAGQGSNLGWKFEHLADIIALVQQSHRIGVCFDTCHAFAAGYDLRDAKGAKAMWRQFDKLLGLERLKAIHLNDSKRELGSRVDRHEHIGHGHIGLDAFRHLLTDKRFRQIPMYLETPKEELEGEHWDAINLRTLRSLVK